MDELKKQFLTDLVLHPADLVASIWILDRIPLIFDQDIKAYATWRRELAQGLGVDASALLVTGSAAFGVSLNPNKNYRFFDQESDIDIAVISDYHFNEAWRTLRALGPALHSMPPRVKQSVADHVERYIYWGTIATDRLLHLLPYGKQWSESLEKMQYCEPTLGRAVKARVYKDFDSLRAYQVNNLTKLKTEEIAKGLNDVKIP